MSVEKLIANVPVRSDAERKVMREHALTWLQSGNAVQVADANQLLTALEAFETSKAAELLARVASAPLAQRVVVAFKTVKPSATEERLIQVLLDNPGSTCAELSSKIGWAPNTWDMGFGALCAQRALILHALADTPKEGPSSNLPLLTLQCRGGDEAIRYTMKPEAIEAFKQLGFRV